MKQASAKSYQAVVNQQQQQQVYADRAVKFAASAQANTQQSEQLYATLQPQAANIATTHQDEKGGQLNSATE